LTPKHEKILKVIAHRKKFYEEKKKAIKANPAKKTVKDTSKTKAKKPAAKTVKKPVAGK